MTYGWAILIIAVVLGILFLLGVFNGTALLGNHCLTEVGFSCQSATFNTYGYLNMTLGQGTGQTIYIRALACASTASSTGYPAYGLTSVASSYLGATGTSVPSVNAGSSTPITPYPETVNGKAVTSNTMTGSNGIAVTSGSTFVVTLPCYNGNATSGSTVDNVIAVLPLGQAFTGQVWINYTTTQTTANPIIQQLTTQLTEKAS